MKKTFRRIQGFIAAIIIGIGSLAVTQYGIGSIADAEKMPGYTESALNEKPVFSGEWIEITDGVVMISSVNTEHTHPTTFPYFYLSPNWESCTEYTYDAPQGKVCSAVFHELLKRADTFLVKE